MINVIELMIYKAYAELKAEASRYYASILWWIVEPVIYMGAFYVVFGLIFKRGGEGFIPFLLCGLIIWKWFAGSINQGSNAILMHLGLIRQIYLHKIIFPGAALLNNAFHFLCVFIVYVIFLIGYGYDPGLCWISVFPLIAAQFLFNSACACLLSAIVPFAPDIRQLVEKVLMLGFFMTGIFFDINTISESYRSYLMMNPMAVLIEGFRSVLLHNRTPQWGPLILIVLLSTFGIWVAQILMKRFDHLYPKVQF